MQTTKTTLIFTCFEAIFSHFHDKNHHVAKHALKLKNHNCNVVMMVIGIASIIPHACGGMILHVLIVIIQIQAPTGMSQIPPYNHHPACVSGLSVGREGL